MCLCCVLTGRKSICSIPPRSSSSLRGRQFKCATVFFFLLLLYNTQTFESKEGRSLESLARGPRARWDMTRWEPNSSEQKLAALKTPPKTCFVLFCVSSFSSMVWFELSVAASKCHCRNSGCVVVLSKIFFLNFSCYVKIHAEWITVKKLFPQVCHVIKEIYIFLIKQK